MWEIHCPNPPTVQILPSFPYIYQESHYNVCLFYLITAAFFCTQLYTCFSNGKILCLADMSVKVLIIQAHLKNSLLKPQLQYCQPTKVNLLKPKVIDHQCSCVQLSFSCLVKPTSASTVFQGKLIHTHNMKWLTLAGGNIGPSRQFAVNYCSKTRLAIVSVIVTQILKLLQIWCCLIIYYPFKKYVESEFFFSVLSKRDVT